MVLVTLENLVALRKILFQGKELTIMHVLVYLCTQEQEVLALPEMAEFIGVSPEVLFRYHRDLRRLGLIDDVLIKKAMPRGYPKRRITRLRLLDEESVVIRRRATVMLGGIRNRASAGGYPNTMTTGAIEKLLKATRACPACGTEFNFSYDKETDKTRIPSVDKIVPSLGYVPGNCAIICFRCNFLKKDATADELMNLSRWLNSVT